MEAPRLIKMLGSDVAIDFLESVIVDNDPAMGAYDQELSCILIKDGMSASSTRDTLMHELLHAILQHYEMDSEKIVRLMTPALLAILRDNPKLVRFFTAGTEYPTHPANAQPYQQGHQTQGIA